MGAIANERLRIEVSPARGGGLLAFDTRRSGAWRPVFRRCADAAGSEPNQLACYPLVPWSNRIGGGRFSFEGREHRVPLTRPDEPLPIHGHGWLSAWHVIDAGEDHVELTHEWRGAHPFSYRASIRYTLEADALAVVLRVANLGERLPFGLGLHPFLPREPGMRLHVPAQGLWNTGEDFLPTALHRPVPADLDFSQRRVLPGELAINHAYTGWSGQARIDYPQSGFALAIESAVNHLVIYVPPGRDFFCVEPVDHPIDALNLAPEHRGGLTVLDTGASLERHFRFVIEELPHD